MKHTYLVITLMLITTSLEILGQSVPTHSADFLKYKIPVIVNSAGVQRISYGGSMRYARSIHSHSMNNFNMQFIDASFNENMPTLNQLQSALLKNIDMTADNYTILQFSNDEEEKPKGNDESDSFFSSSLFYFLGAAALATTFYFIWQDNQNETATRTFGYPPRPDTEP